ncbi:MAG TPA: hypothetical protein VLD67_02835 [Vicinamibacterales bacterium]|nr:hypothetical protein [Vicinamibacterales bacterium]
MDDRTDALNRIVALARQHGLSAEEIAAAIGHGHHPASENRWQNILVRVLGFLGGIFVFAGVGVFIALQWDDLNSAARIVITLGPGVAAFVLAVLAGRDLRVAKAATPLFLAAAGLQPTGMLVAFAEMGSGGDWRWASLVTSAVMAAQFGAAFAALRRSTLLFLSMVFGTLFWWTALDLADVDGQLIALVLGSAMLMAAVWAHRSGRGDITPFWYFVGAAAFLAGLFDMVERTPFEVVFLAAAAGFVYASAVLQSRTLLSVATLAILAYTGWFTGQHFVDSIGWPLALMAFGLALIGLSALALRIDREYVRPRA